MASLNQIFFGPPGTGKTYATIEATLEILDPVYLAAHRKDRSTLKKRFDELSDAGDVRFVTFHQSFSYEDFVEGLRAETDGDGQLRYSVVPGVFKSMCSHPSGGQSPFKIGDRYGTGYKVVRASVDVVEIEKPQGKHLPIGMSLLNELAGYVKAGTFTVEDLRNGEWDKKASGSTLEPYLVNGYKNLIPSLVAQIVNTTDSGSSQLFAKSKPVQKSTPKVLIIDEINRGNISRIFGELITLIEPSKRADASEALEVMLPYSKERFSIPSNIYLIGTMNTADRSLAALDIALRRRFNFIEVPPNPELLDDVEVDGIAINELLDVINRRIATLLDRDHRLGHAYFMGLTSQSTLNDLETIFTKQILPLLQEYFFEDWERIQWVLNDQRKAPENRFLVQSGQDLNVLFGDSVSVNQNSGGWELNPAAFKKTEAYLGIIDHALRAETPITRYEPREVQHGELTLRQSGSGTIEVLRNGVIEKPTKPVLLDLAEKLGISPLTSNGEPMTTRRFGRKIIKHLGEQQG
jgi:5-methylcytosine-specific restriction protein B